MNWIPGLYSGRSPRRVFFLNRVGTIGNWVESAEIVDCDAMK